MIAVTIKSLFEVYELVIAIMIKRGTGEDGENYGTATLARTALLTIFNQCETEIKVSDARLDSVISFLKVLSIETNLLKEIDFSKEISQEFWNRQIGQLPEGFYIEIHDFDLEICYNGPGYKEIIECGGKRPPKCRKYAFLGLHTIRCYKLQKLETLITEVVSFAQGCVRRAQKQLSALV